jgi:plastocyanin
VEDRLRALKTAGTAALVVGVAALAPAAAQARTKVVNLGVPPASQAKFDKHGATVQDFFPHGVAINVGDTVSFAPAGFHNLDLPAKGADPDAFALPTGDKVTGVKDAANADFWFNGLDVLSFNPRLFASEFGKKLSYDGTKGIQSGLPLGPGLKPVKVKFRKAGKYTYFCSIHPGMKGTVDVRKRGRKVPTAKQDRKALATQIARDLKVAKRLPKKVVPAGTVDVGVAGPHGVEYFGMLPAQVKVKVGDTLNFRMTKGSFEAHTATFGPGNPATEKDSYLGGIAGSFEKPPFDSRAVYPSEAPGGSPATLTSTLHGNGFWNSGLMDTSTATPLPESNSVKFGQKGTYAYYCLLHPDMRGTVVVE